MTNLRSKLLIILTVVFAGVLHAQQAAQNTAPPPSAPQQSSEMKKLLDAMTGTWTTVVKFEPGEQYPTGGEGRGKQIFESGPGGLSLIEHETAATPGGGEWAGMSVTWWDVQASGFRAIWCDNHHPSGCIVMKNLAHWQGADFVLGDEWIQNGKKVIYREVCSDLKSDSFTLTSYQGESESELKKILTVHATRIHEPK